MRAAFTFLFFLFTSASLAQAVEFRNPKEILAVSGFVSVMEDPDKKMTLEEVMKSSHFKPSKDIVPNLGVSTSAFWLKFDLVNRTNEEKLLMELPCPAIDRIDLFSPLDGRIAVGERWAYGQRIYNHQNYIFRITAPKDRMITCYMRIETGEQLLVPLYLGTMEKIYDSLLVKDLLFGIYAGVILVTFLYNLFMYITVRDKNYLFYILYVFTVGLTQTCIQGYTFRFLFPDAPWFSNLSYYLLCALVGITAMIFQASFLQTYRYAPRLFKISLVFISIYILCIILALTGYYKASQQLIQWNAVSAFFTLFISLYLLRRGNKSARLFSMAWLVFLTGVIIFYLKDFGVLPYSMLTAYTMPAGSAIELIILSFAIWERVKQLKKENEEKQDEIIRHLRANEEFLKITQELALDTERLNKEVIASQYQLLKSQLNPHFLFNSLNVLTELVYQNQANAVSFVKKLSDVYRYIMETNEEEVVELARELHFIRSFLFLLQIRYNENLKVEIDLPESQELFIIPLGLQVLVENVIKHNIITEECPMLITMKMEGEYMVIGNNINKKTTEQRQSGIGLDNIFSRYKYLTDLPVQVYEDGHTFIVKIPVVKFDALE